MYLPRRSYNLINFDISLSFHTLILNVPYTFIYEGVIRCMEV